MDEDIKFLKQTLALAKRGIGWVNPNPMVGAVLVKDGQIIAKGYHRKAGFPHAEEEALKNCTVSPKGAILYVNLEPCAHFGKTPPCTDAIIRSQIKRVVCAGLDPNPKTHGQGVARLRKVGIDISVGLLEDEARASNEAFFTFHEKKRPFVAIKFAASLDGKIATHSGNSKWISNEKARDWARNLRGNYQAILVGINTVIKDDPHLGVRRVGKKDPVRIILDSTLKIPLKSQVLRDDSVIIATTVGGDKKKQEILTRKGVSLLIFKGKSVPLIKLLAELRKREIISVLVEGGGKVIGSFLDMKLADKVYVFHAPILIGGGKAISIGGRGVSNVAEALHLKNLSYRRFDDNRLTVGDVVWPEKTSFVGRSYQD